MGLICQLPFSVGSLAFTAVLWTGFGCRFPSFSGWNTPTETIFIAQIKNPFFSSSFFLFLSCFREKYLEWRNGTSVLLWLGRLFSVGAGCGVGLCNGFLCLVSASSEKSCYLQLLLKPFHLCMHYLAEISMNKCISFFFFFFSPFLGKQLLLLLWCIYLK